MLVQKYDLELAIKRQVNSHMTFGPLNHGGLKNLKIF